ncbi:MAG: LCP family protein [Anaerolineae bacterium]|nr:LCP family protein [Anaerolineae bacterium]MDW8173321.1 LCP family protein [Anaerolineae bacterium]
MRILRWIFWGLMPALLILATLWSAWLTWDALSRSQNTIDKIESRRDAYAATATAFATADGEAALWRVAQFLTNTPIATAAPIQSSPTSAPPSSTPQPLAQPQAATPFVAPTFFPAPAASIAEMSGTAVPTPVPVIPRNYELINIVLLGSDEELTEDTTIRTDTIIIVSINTQTRTVSMLSLPRDLFIYVPTPTMARLNTVYGIGESFGWSGGGFGLLREVIFYNFGINVHYYAKVNFSGFETIIDALGGIDLAVDCTYQDYYPVEDFDISRSIEENYKLRTLPVGYYRMNGFDALWYARTRRLTTDFDRGRRQQQLLRAIFRAARANGQLANLPQLWSEVTQVVETNIPFEVVLGLLPIGLELDPNMIENFVLIRTYHTTPWQPSSGPYAGQFVQLPNYEPMRELLLDFYQPPTDSRIALGRAKITVYNGTNNPDWDKVAAERLATEGFSAVAGGPAERTDYPSTQIVDYVGESKGSPVAKLLSILNSTPDSVSVQPDPNRTTDYAIILGANYNSCDAPVMGVEGQ